MPIYLGTDKLDDLKLGTSTVSKIYIGTNLYYQKITSVTVTLKGAVSEIITYSGEASGSVPTDANGNATVTLVRGTYTFIGGVSGYSTTVSISNDSTVLVRPEHIVYWYGVYGMGTMTLGKTGVGSNTATDYTNYVYLKSQRNSSGNIRMTWWTTNLVTLDDYSKLKATFSTTETNGWHYASYGTSRTGYGTGYAAISGKNVVETVECPISSVGQYYVGLSGSAYNKTGYVYANVYAIWLE